VHRIDLCRCHGRRTRGRRRRFRLGWQLAPIRTNSRVRGGHSRLQGSVGSSGVNERGRRVRRNNRRVALLCGRRDRGGSHLRRWHSWGGDWRRRRQRVDRLLVEWVVGFSLEGFDDVTRAANVVKRTHATVVTQVAVRPKSQEHRGNVQKVLGRVLSELLGTGNERRLAQAVCEIDVSGAQPLVQ